MARERNYSVQKGGSTMKNFFFKKKSPTPPPSSEAKDVEFLRSKHTAFSAVEFVDNLINSGMLFVRQKESEVYISTRLVYLYADRVRWKSFLRAVGWWFTYYRVQDAWIRKFRDAENAAIREEGKTPEELGELKVREIKWEARQKVDPSAVTVAELQQGNFSFVLVDETDNSMIVVGSYKDGNIEMRSFDEVKHRLNL